MPYHWFSFRPLTTRQIAIYGYSFCNAAQRAFGIIYRNLDKVAAVNWIGDFLLLLGRLVVIICTTLLAYLYIQYGFVADELSFSAIPLFVRGLSHTDAHTRTHPPHPVHSALGDA